MMSNNAFIRRRKGGLEIPNNFNEHFNEKMKNEVLVVSSSSEFLLKKFVLSCAEFFSKLSRL